MWGVLNPDDECINVFDHYKDACNFLKLIAGEYWYEEGYRIVENYDGFEVKE